MRLKQRIVQILIREIIVEVDGEGREIVLLIHWMDGRHLSCGSSNGSLATIAVVHL
jgi:hypothetical protein